MNNWLLYNLKLFTHFFDTDRPRRWWGGIGPRGWHGGSFGPDRKATLDAGGESQANLGKFPINRSRLSMRLISGPVDSPRIPTNAITGTNVFSFVRVRKNRGFVRASLTTYNP